MSCFLDFAKARLKNAQPIIDGCKLCTKCNESKSVLEFYKHPNTNDGFQSQCKSCTSKAGRKSAITHRREPKRKNSGFCALCNKPYKYKFCEECKRNAKNDPERIQSVQDYLNKKLRDKNSTPVGERCTNALLRWKERVATLNQPMKGLTEEFEQPKTWKDIYSAKS